MRNPFTICGNHLQLAESVCFCGFRIQILRIQRTFADSTYNLRNPLIIAESRSTSYICLLRNPQQNKCADKTYATSICMRNPLKFCLWNPLTSWNIFKSCLWNPETYRHKIVLLSSAQFGLVMALSDCHERKRADNSDSRELQRSYR